MKDCLGVSFLTFEKRLKIVFILFFILNVGCTKSIVETELLYQVYFENLLSLNMVKRQNATFKMHSYEKKIIPFLIDKIDINKKVLINLMHPLHSTFIIRSFENYAGFLAAYIIELIIGREELSMDNPMNRNFMLGCGGKSIKNYLYINGVIVREDEQEIKFDDMKRIKQIYKNWWQKNKQNSLEELRKEWKQGNRPLSGTFYQWR